MSGGHFNYNQHRIDDIANDLEEIIKHNGSEELDEYGDRVHRNYNPETIKEFHKAMKILKLAYIYTQRIDWLLSGDDGEETFHERLKDNLEKLDE